jgi:hypothetical protein
MPKYYSFEKGKYGSATGTIALFPRTLSGKDPSGNDWTAYVPAGYLRCDGSIWPADRFRRLAEVIGVGEECIYRKPGTVLEEPDENGNGGEIQVPDLGSKYITAFSSNTGIILDSTTPNPTNPATTQEKVGVGVDLTLNQGPSVTVSYSGNMVFPPTNIPTSGNYALSLQSISANSTYSIDQILGHGHYSNTARLTQQNPTTENAAIRIPSGSNANDPAVLAYNVIEIESVGVISEGTVESTQHFHSIGRTNPTHSISANIREVSDVPGENITTTITLASEDTKAFNDINPAFVLVEYLIKY